MITIIDYFKLKRYSKNIILKCSILKYFESCCNEFPFLCIFLREGLSISIIENKDM